jgi:dTDP-4-amino-4,6-dideoxygalactose transaminase
MATVLAEIGPNDEVVLPSFTFASTANSVVLRGSIPVFVDIRPDTLNLDERIIENAITERTRGIIAVHYAGVCADMDAINSVATKHGLLVIEDAAQALLSSYKGRPAGALAHVGAISFHETKNVTCGQGGALLTNAGTMDDRARVLRDQGTNRGAFSRGVVDKYTWIDVGSDFAANQLSAACLYAQLEEAEVTTNTRRRIWDQYKAEFTTLERAGRLRTPTVPAECVHNGHIFYLLLQSIEDRKRFMAHMAQAGIETTFHYVPLHSSPAGQRFGRTVGDLDVTEDISTRLVRLPLYPAMEYAVPKIVEVASAYLTQAPPHGARGD